MAPNNPVRAYDAFVEDLDFNALGIEIDSNQVGNSEYDPLCVSMEKKNRLWKKRWALGIKMGGLTMLRSC